MSHQVLSPQQFAGQTDLPEEKSIDAPNPAAVEPEKEDEDIGQAPN